MRVWHLSQPQDGTYTCDAPTVRARRLHGMTGIRTMLTTNMQGWQVTKVPSTTRDKRYLPLYSALLHKQPLSPPHTHNVIGPLITLLVVKELVIQEIWSNKNICQKFVCLHRHGKFTHYGEVILFIHLLMLKSIQEKATSYNRVPGNRMEHWPLKTSHTLHTPITPSSSPSLVPRPCTHPSEKRSGEC